MSSSSSYEQICDCYNYETSYYEQNYYNANRTPFYPTMGHPLVYYANVPQPVNRRQCRDHEKSPNCFVKAFRWYTQDHVPYRTEPYKTEACKPEVCNKCEMSTKRSVTGFAAWLDDKYDEFLEERLKDCQITVKETAIITTDKRPNKICSESCTNIKRKRKRLNKSKCFCKKKGRSNKDESDEASTASFQYIMQPKELNVPDSEQCCQPSTQVSYDGQRRQTYQSQSCTNIDEKTKDEPIDIPPIPTQEGTCIEKEKSIKKEAVEKQVVIVKEDGCQSSRYKIDMKDAQTQDEPCGKRTSILKSPMISNKSLMVCQPCYKTIKTMTGPSLTNHNNVECQCSGLEVSVPEVKAEKTNPPQQIRFTRSVCENTVVKVRQSKSPVEWKSKVVCQCQTAHYGTPKETKPCPCPPAQSAPAALSAKHTQSFYAQTSNFSIKLEKDTTCTYPLFMKVVCADKLSKENFTQ